MVLASAEDAQKQSPAFEAAFESAGKLLKAAGVKAALEHGDQYELRYNPGMVEIAERHDHDCMFQHGNGQGNGTHEDSKPHYIPAPPDHRVLDSDAKYTQSRTNADIVNGLGEYYAFVHLKANLPEFTVDCWTSELRGKVYKETPFSGEARASITYHDVRGKLTAALYGLRIKDAWGPEWPTYHMDVKTTTGGLERPVDMTDKEFSVAAEMSIIDPSVVPTDIYAVVRVTHLKLSTRKIRIFPDIHRLLYDRKVQVSGSSTSVVFTL